MPLQNPDRNTLFSNLMFREHSALFYIHYLLFPSLKAPLLFKNWPRTTDIMMIILFLYYIDLLDMC